MSERRSHRSVPAWRRLLPLGLGLALLLLLFPVSAHAQQRDLAAIDSLIAAEEFAAARTGIAAWWKEHAARAANDPALRARALFLRARLETDPALARDDYLAIALGAPTAPEASAALLYLAQGYIATGEHQRGIAYLERLMRDYPYSQHRENARLWLVRALRSVGRADAACSLARERGGALQDPELEVLIAAEENDACSGAPPAPAVQPSPAAPPAGERAPERAAKPAGVGRYALQIGAFREGAGAGRLVERLRKAGFEPRVAHIPGSSLRRVRIGRFASAAEAQPVIDALRAAGFDLVVVNDADREVER